MEYKQQTEPCNLASLSCETLCHILRYLPLKETLALAMLCRKLSTAVEMHFQMRKSLDFNQDDIFGYMPSTITDDHIHCLLKKCPRLEVVYGLHPLKLERRRLRKRSSLTVPGIIDALSICPCLKAVETCDLKLLEAILQHLPQIEIIGHFRNRDGIFPPHASQRLKLQPYPRLTSLHLIGVDVPELTAMPQVRHLHLHCVRFTKLQPFRAFLAQNLKTFVMKHCMGPTMSIRYLSLIIALTSCPELERLELVRVPLPGGLFQRAIEDSYKNGGFMNLKTLVLAGCKGILESDIGYLMIVASAHLEAISIQPSLTKDSLFVSLQFANCTFEKLRTLHLGYVDKFQSMGEWSNDALLTFGLAELPDTPSSLTDSGMKVVGYIFPNLQALTVSNCPHLISMNLWGIGEMPAWGSVTDLILQRCHCLQLQSFSTSLMQMPQVQIVILEDMFREPPKGCSHVGLSAGTGLGMSSAVVSNQDEHIAVQGHQHDLEPQGDDADNEENDRDIIEIDFDDIPPFRDNEPHFMVLRQDFFDEQDDDFDPLLDHRDVDDNEISEEENSELAEMDANIENEAILNASLNNEDVISNGSDIDIESLVKPSISFDEFDGKQNEINPYMPSTSSLQSENKNALKVIEKSSDSELDASDVVIKCENNIEHDDDFYNESESKPLSNVKLKSKSKKKLAKICRKSARLNNKRKNEEFSSTFSFGTKKNKNKTLKNSDLCDSEKNKPDISKLAHNSHYFDPTMPSTSKDGNFIDFSNEESSENSLQSNLSYVKVKKENIDIEPKNDMENILKCKTCGGNIISNNYKGPLTRSRKKTLDSSKDPEKNLQLTNCSNKSKLIKDVKKSKPKYCQCKKNSTVSTNNENETSHDIGLASEIKQFYASGIQNQDTSHTLNYKGENSKLPKDVKQIFNDNKTADSKKVIKKKHNKIIFSLPARFRESEDKNVQIKESEDRLEMISQGTQATSADIRRALRVQKLRNLGRIKHMPQRTNSKVSLKKRISAKEKSWKVKSKELIDTKDKATSTSDPLLEEDAVQELRLVSTSLISITIISCGISDIIVNHCNKLVHLEAHACRILKKVQLGYCIALARLYVTQCPKLSLSNIAAESQNIQINRWLMVYYEPYFQEYDILKDECDIFSIAPTDFNVVMFHDFSNETREEIVSQRKEFVFRWLEMVWFMIAEGIRKGVRNRRTLKNENGAPRIKYPWGHFLQRKYGHFIVPEVTNSGVLIDTDYQLTSNSNIFMFTFENSDFKQGFPSVDDTYYEGDLSDLKSLTSRELVENDFFYTDNVIGYYIKRKR